MPWYPLFKSIKFCLTCCFLGKSILLLPVRTCNHQEPQKRAGQLTASTAQYWEGYRGKWHDNTPTTFIRVSHILSHAANVNKLNVWEQNDVSGRCTIEYKAVKGQVTRTKILETCKTAETGFTTHSQVCQHPDQLAVLKYERY